MSRNIIAGCAAIAVVSSGLVATAAAATVPSTAPTAAVASATTVRPNAKTMYVVATSSRDTARLQLVDRRTGATLATLASRALVRMDGRAANPYEDATIGPDGTVWAIQWTGGMYGHSLLRINDGRVNTFMPYVRAARVSPDGKRIAVSVLSPDANKDGKGTTSVRVGSTAGGPYRSIFEETFRVGKDGDPQGIFFLPMVGTWLGNRHLALEYGCCDDGNVSVVSADVASRSASWAVINGDANTEVAAKVDDQTALVPMMTGYHTKDREWISTGYDILKVTPAAPRGTKIAHTSDPDRYLATSGALLMTGYNSTLPYRTVPGTSLDRRFVAR